ncbi:hypothetical protein LCGC14_2957250 [marine sediment metagenome]|uniref:Uncharacterized protein n=1 Tax=marine sediment metagenome TaxID=412755 RepID=A0A0F9A4N0_9ZZZZ
METCKHKTLEFIGIQETLTKNKPFLLFNCLYCETTINYSVMEFFNLLLNFKKEASKHLILSR